MIEQGSGYSYHGLQEAVIETEEDARADEEALNFVGVLLIRETVIGVVLQVVDVCVILSALFGEVTVTENASDDNGTQVKEYAEAVSNDSAHAKRPG